MKIIVVEPHADDAFLSLGWHLEKIWKECEKTILTVYCDDRRAKEAEEYANAIGAQSWCLKVKESLMDSKGPIYPAKELSDVEWGRWDEVIFPLGLQHPDHLRVAFARPPQALLYVDTPYQTKQKLAESLLGKAEGMLVESICYPGKRKWHRSGIFKSQAKFFYYNGGLAESLLPEMVLRVPKGDGA